MTTQYSVKERYTEHNRSDCNHYFYVGWSTVLTTKEEAEKEARNLNDFYGRYGRVFNVFSREVGEWEILEGSD